MFAPQTCLLLRQCQFGGLNLGDQAVYLDKTNAPRNMDIETYLSAYGSIDQHMGIANLVQSAKNLDEIRKMSPEEFKRYKSNLAVQAVNNTKEVAHSTASSQRASLRNTAAIIVQRRLKGKGIVAGVSSIYRVVDDIYDDAYKATPTNDDGVKDPAKFEENFNKLLQEKIDKANAKKKE